MLNLLLGKKKFSNPKRPGTIPETCNIRKLKYIYLHLLQLTPVLGLNLVFVLDLAKRVGSPEWPEVIIEDNIPLTLIRSHSQGPRHFLHILKKLGIIHSNALTFLKK